MNTSPGARFLPLAGIKVLDLSKVLAGPLCTQYLADLGAEVTKVEPPGGDDTRHWPPFEAGEGTIFLAVNRNKRSLALDLRRPEGRAICERLARDADVMIESLGPGAAERLGLGEAAMRTANPRLIHCSISGYGSVGPMKDAKGYDLVAQAFTGMLSITGEPEGPPVRSPFSPVDQAAGMNLVIGILAALRQRDLTGTGARLESSLFDSAVGFLGYFLQGYWQRGTEPLKPGSGHESLCPYQAFETKDRPLILGVANDSLWRSFCAVAGYPALAEDTRFLTGADRVRNRPETVRIVAEIMRERTRAQWMDLLQAQSIPCSPVHSLGELDRHPHTEASGMVFGYTRGQQTLKGVATPLRIDGKRPALRTAPPRLGEHSEAVLADLGYTKAEIADLLDRGVVLAG